MKKTILLSLLFLSLGFVAGLSYGEHGFAYRLRYGCFLNKTYYPEIQQRRTEDGKGWYPGRPAHYMYSCAFSNPEHQVGVLADEF